MKIFLLAFGVLFFSASNVFAVQSHDEGKTHVKTLAEIQAELLEKIESGELEVNPLIMGERRRAVTGVRHNYRRGAQKENSVEINQHRRPRYTRRVSRQSDRTENESSIDTRKPRVYSRAIFPYKKKSISID